MEQLILELLKSLNDILAGIPLEYHNIPEKDRRTALIIALHCVLNGPVGVGKDTTFPLVGKAQIRGLLGCTNSSWAGFCREVATVVKRAEPAINCGTRRRSGDYWPLTNK